MAQVIDLAGRRQVRESVEARQLREQIRQREAQRRVALGSVGRLDQELDDLRARLAVLVDGGAA